MNTEDLLITKIFNDNDFFENMIVNDYLHDINMKYETHVGIHDTLLEII